MKKWFMILAALVTGLARAGDLPPDVLVKETAQDVLAIVKKDKDIQSGSQKKLLDLVEAKVLPHFDFKHMTRLAVGKHWRAATPAQQESLTNEFRTMLVRTYSNSLSAYKNQTIEYKPFTMKPGDTDVTVKTQVVQPGGQPVPINYALEKQAEGWKVYDVEVDGVSLVTNYRGSFGTEIGKTGIDGLIKTLVDKNQSAAKK